MTHATGGLLREIWWYVDNDDAETGAPAMLIATLARCGGVSVCMPINGEYDHEDLLVLTDRITRFFLVIHGEHLFGKVGA